MPRADESDVRNRLMDRGMILVITARGLLARSARRASERFKATERGASLVEYALLVALIGVVCIGAVTVLGANASSKFSKVGSAIGS
jgi:pilus assembly protein Flp/PilA